MPSSCSIRRAIKHIPYSSSNYFISQRIQFSKECSSSVSTLVQVYHYEISAKEGRGDNNGRGQEVAI